MEPTSRTWGYLKDMKAVLVESKLIIGSENHETSEVYINRRNVFRKRNGKLCHVDYRGKWVKVPREYFRSRHVSEERMARKYFQQDDMMETVTRTIHYIRSEDKKKILEEYA